MTPIMRKLLLATLLGTWLCGTAWARLGGDVASVQADQQAWGGTTTHTWLAGTTLYTHQLPDGMQVRQYVDASGLVFAVAWEGPVLPDFERLLGASFQTYTAAQRQQKRGVNLQNVDLVIESGGMMRSFAGRAYLPPKLPVNLLARDIR
jgi:hypothetical protein